MMIIIVKTETNKLGLIQNRIWTLEGLPSKILTTLKKRETCKKNYEIDRVRNPFDRPSKFQVLWINKILKYSNSNFFRKFKSEVAL